MGLRLFDSQQFLNFVPANHYIRNWENPTAGKCWHLTPPSTSMSHCPRGNSSFCSLVWLYGHHLLNVFKKSSCKVPVGLGSYWTAEQHFRVEPSSLSSCYGITFPDHAGTFASQSLNPQVPEIPLMTLCCSCNWKPVYGMWGAAFVPVVFAHLGCLVFAAASTGTVPLHPAPGLIAVD